MVVPHFNRRQTSEEQDRQAELRQQIGRPQSRAGIIDNQAHRQAGRRQETGRVTRETGTGQAQAQTQAQADDRQHYSNSDRQAS